MPSAYTEPIYAGKTVEAVTLACSFARALGFTMHQRDESLTVPPAKRAPSDYYRKRIEELEDERARLLALSPEDAQQELDESRAEVIKFNREARVKHEAMRARYQRALDVFEQWEPVTEAGVAVKKQAIQQLEESQEFDAGGEAWQRSLPRNNPTEWLRDRLEENKRSLDLARESWNDEVSRCAEVNTWVEDFYSDVKTLEGIVLNDDEATVPVP